MERGKSKRYDMSKEVIIIGAGGHGKVLADAIMQSGDRVLGFLDDDVSLPSQVCGIPVLGVSKDYVNYPGAYFVIGTGRADSRRRLSRLLEGVKWYTVIHPSAIVSGMDTHIGEGTVILANAVVNAGTYLGRHCIINTGAVVDHENRLGDFCHVAVGAKLAGTVSIGESTWVGIGACVSNNLTICGNCMIGAGTVVVRSIEEPGTYVGVPARKIK